MVHHREERRDEDHRRQDLKGKDETRRSLGINQSIAENELGPFASAVQDGFDALAGSPEQFDSGGHSQDQQGKGPLQPESPEDNPPGNGPAVVGKEDGDQQDRDHSREATQPIGHVGPIRVCQEVEQNPGYIGHGLHQLNF